MIRGHLGMLTHHRVTTKFNTIRQPVSEPGPTHIPVQAFPLVLQGGMVSTSSIAYGRTILNDISTSKLGQTFVAKGDSVGTIFVRLVMT